MPDRKATEITVTAHDYAVKACSSTQNDLLDVTDYHSIDYRNDCYQTLVGHSRSVRGPHRADAHVSWPERSRSHLNHCAHPYPNCFRALVVHAW